MIASCPNDHPNQIVMDLHSGAVVNRNLHANYVLQGNRVQILDTASVPLRLTRNVSTLLGPYWEEGSFKYTLGALALVVVTRGGDA